MRATYMDTGGGGRPMSRLLLVMATVISVAVLPLSPTRALAECSAIYDGSGGGSIAVGCNAGDENAPFATIAEYPGYDGSGPDTVNMLGGVILQNSENGPPELSVYGTELDGATAIMTLGNDDTFEMSGGQIGADGDAVDIRLGDGGDTLTLSGGTVWGTVYGEAGDEDFDLSGGTINQSILAGLGNDRVTISGTATIAGSVLGDDGVDTVAMTGGSIGGDIDLGYGDDVFSIDSGTVGGAVNGDAGNDTFTFRGGTISGPVEGGLGVDTFTVRGGAIEGSLLGQDGDDIFDIAGASIMGSVLGGGDLDDVTMTGGAVAGDISAESVTLNGGMLGGDVSGLSFLTIDNTTGLDLRDGVVFSGMDAVGSIDGAQLADQGFQNFSGFANLSLINGSSLAFTDDQGIDGLALSGGSSLIIDGNVTMRTRAGGLATISASDSTINFVDGDVSDRLTLGGLVFENATLGLDINQVMGKGDQLRVADDFTATGSNTILVNLLDTPDFLDTTEITIVDGDFEIDPSAFKVEGVPGTAASLFDYKIVPGSLVLVATPSDISPALATQSAIDSQPVVTALDAIDSTTDAAAEHGLKLAGGGTQVQISPTFGIFATGQFARVEHDGFDVSNGFFAGVGPGFSSDDFSAAISFDFNAAKYFRMDNKYGLNIGLFGGYTSSDVALGSYGTFPMVGAASNESGMIGTYGLFRHQLNYVLVSGAAFFGNTDIVNQVLASTGSYETTGYAATASAGHIFPLTDTVRFDLRGGVLGVTFSGDPYTDSRGNRFGKSRISFGAVTFDPGIYMDRKLENGMVFSPYARMNFQQRFAYENRSSISGIEFNFDDADFSVSLSGGFNLKVSKTSTVSAEVRGKVSGDSTTLAGKIGYKASF